MKMTIGNRGFQSRQIYGNNINAMAGNMRLNAASKRRFSIAALLHTFSEIASADNLVRKIIKGITKGKPSTAISVALFPARDAIALMVVKRKE